MQFLKRPLRHVGKVLLSLVSEMVELPDTRGLICAFRLRVNATAEALSWDCTSDGDWSFEGAVWLHFSLGDVRAKKWIKSCARLPDRAREILLDTDPHIRLESIGNGFAGCLVISISNLTTIRTALV